MGRTPDIFEDLRSVGSFKQNHMSSRPTNNALSKIGDPPVSRDTIGAWMEGKRFPRNLEQLLAALRAIHAEAERQEVLDTPVNGRTGESIGELLAEHRWRQTWRAEHQRRTKMYGDAAAAQQSRRALQAEEQQAPSTDLRDRSRPVRAWSAQRLGVHPAISGTGAPHTDGFVLPAYIPRPHDELLRNQLARAVADHTSMLAVVRGQSCTGKTRTAFEALASVPEDFRLLVPTNAESLVAMLDEGACGPRTVLWLNEAQHYLSGPAGEAAATELLHRLDAEGPFIVLGTLWPDHHRALTTTSASHEGDPHRQARTLLAQAAYTHVPDSFAGHLHAVRQAAELDASLAASLLTGGDGIAQILAAGPDLVTHYDFPESQHGVLGRSLISAAMDAHRLGVIGPLPLSFLRDAAPGYLTEAERADADPGTWFSEALTYARTLIKQVVRPLQSVPRPSGMGAQPGVLALADYLQQHARRSRWRVCPPAAFWDSAARHLTGPEDLLQVARAAHRRRRYRHAAHLYCASSDAGNPYALVRLARLREQTGDAAGAERLFRAAATSGDLRALRGLAEAHQKGTTRGETEELYRAAADTGNPYAALWLAGFCSRVDTRGLVEQLYDVAVAAEDSTVIEGLAQDRAEAGDGAAAELLAVHASTIPYGTAWGLYQLARRWERSGNHKGAERLTRHAMDVGASYVLTAVAEEREEAGDVEGAERLYREAAADGDNSALLWLMDRLEEAGDPEGGLRLCTAAAEAGNLYSGVLPARRQEAVGNLTEAERLYRAAADTRNPYALMWIAAGHERDGDTEEAERLRRAAAATADAYTLADLAEQRREAGDHSGAEELYVATVDIGYQFNVPVPESLWPFGLEADGSPSAAWAWPEPRALADGAS